MRLFVALFSLLTLTGGHFINRRLDKGSLFFAIYFLAMAGFVTFGFGLLREHQHTLMEPYVLLYAGVAVVALLWLSAIITYLDYDKRTTLPVPRASGAIAGMLLTLLSVPALFYTLFTAYTVWSMAGGYPHSPSEDWETSHPVYFHKYFRFGGKSKYGNELNPIVAGSRRVSGTIRYNGGPASGVGLTAVLNGEFVTAEVKTDEHGDFHFTVPDGDWYINRIETTSWTGARDKQEYVVLTGREQKLSTGRYDHFNNWMGTGLKVYADGGTEQLQPIALTIADAIELHWPTEKKTQTDALKDRIHWQPHPGAARYRVQIDTITRTSARSSSHRLLTWATTSDTQVSLIDLGLIPTETPNENEYGVQIYAFDEADTRLSYMTVPGQYSFVLTQHELAAKESGPRFPGLDIGSQLTDTTDIITRHKDKKRLDAAETLAVNNLPDAARQLLLKINSEAFDTRRKTIEGMILVAEGKCEEADFWFDELSAETGTNCHPRFYQERCQPDGSGAPAR